MSVVCRLKINQESDVPLYVYSWTASKDANIYNIVMLRVKGGIFYYNFVKSFLILSNDPRHPLQNKWSTSRLHIYKSS
jgi:hypothetical protein